MERLLREVLQPINACKKKWIKDEDMVVSEYIKFPKCEAKCDCKPSLIEEDVEKAVHNLLS